jgi:DNA-binding CsgD family transcriptional regulator
MLEAALATFDGAGAPAWSARARDGLARLGRPGSGGDTLTETERRLAELAASGLTNTEVAARAFVSVKTVEANLTRVYRKLGVRSRVGLANALREAQGEAPPA